MLALLAFQPVGTKLVIDGQQVTHTTPSMFRFDGVYRAWVGAGAGQLWMISSVTRDCAMLMNGGKCARALVPFIRDGLAAPTRTYEQETSEKHCTVVEVQRVSNGHFTTPPAGQAEVSPLTAIMLARVTTILGLFELLKTCPPTCPRDNLIVAVQKTVEHGFELAAAAAATTTAIATTKS